MSQEVGLSEMMQRTFKQPVSQPQPALIAITLCLSVLAIVGIFGNILVVFFFYKGLRDLPQNVYVIALATLDTTVCAIVIPSTIYQDIWRGTTTDLLCKGFHVLRCSLVTSSAFLLCLIAVDRFAIICFVPGIQTGRRKSVRLIGLTLLLGFAIGTPLGLTTGTRRTMIVRVAGKTHSWSEHTRHCTADYSILSRMTVRIYKACLTGLFICMLLAIVFFYINILYFVRRRNRRWEKSRSYVSRVSAPSESRCGAETHRADREEESDADVNNVDKCKTGGACATVRFVNDKNCKAAGEAELGRCVLETDIDQVLVDPVAITKASKSCDVIPSRGDEEVCEATPIEQRRMLSGQRREDSVTSNRLAKAQQHLSERSRKRPHIKTAKVLSIITFFYLLSYLPFFLVFHLQETGGEGNGGSRGGGSGGSRLPTQLFSDMNVTWNDYNLAQYTNQTSEGRNQSGLLGSGQPMLPWLNKFAGRVNTSGAGSRSVGGGGGAGGEGLFMQTVYYFYFINHGVNPIIYGCMNTYFKQQVYGMYNSIRLSCRGQGS